ncbi:MAG: alpha-amylase family glycosyl hydrolase [Promethearchaeota archaeon]
MGIGGRKREIFIDNQDTTIGLSENWKKSSIYQIYPRSFADSNNDGIGDLKGLISKLTYFKWLGVDTIWLAPIYPSPMVDFGYDITDYTNIDPIFGSLDDFDELVAKTHQLDLRIILDFLPNHSSDQHPWFKESRASRTNPKRDWYIWRDPREDGGPPNNWLAVTGGFSWNWDEKTKQYYLHSFLPCQPDLNWRNPEVRKAMLDSLRFWLDRGVDGLQLTMINWIAKDEQLHDDPLNPNYDPKMDSPYNSLIHLYSCNRPELFEYLKEIRQLFDEYPDRVVIVEVDYSGPLKTDPTYFETGDVIDIPLDLKFKTLPWNASFIKEYVDSYERALPPHAWPNYQLGRHDQTRLVSRIGEEQARVAAMLLLTLRGIPFIYYGSELGMRDVPIPIDQMQDPWEKIVPGKGRDPERTPMQWSPKVNAGFSSVKPWLPIAEDYKKINVETERKNPHSLLNLYRQLITLRCNNLSLSLGSYESENDIPMDCYVYHRQYQDSHHLVTLNFSSEERIITLPSLKGSKIVLSTYLDRGEVLVTNFIPLRGNEGCLIELAELEKE